MDRVATDNSLMGPAAVYGEPPQGDGEMSDESVLMEDDAPEGAGSSSQSLAPEEDEDPQYEDNTEVDQDVVLQPEADQTSYNSDNDILPVMAHEQHQHHHHQHQQQQLLLSRQAHFIPVAPPGSGPVYHQQQHSQPATFHPHVQSGTNMIRGLSQHHGFTTVSNSMGVQSIPVHYQMSHQQQQPHHPAGSVVSSHHQGVPQPDLTQSQGHDTSLDHGTQGNTNTFPEEDQVETDEAGRVIQEDHSGHHGSVQTTRSSKETVQAVEAESQSPDANLSEVTPDSHEAVVNSHSMNGASDRQKINEASQTRPPKSSTVSGGTHTGKQHVGSGAIAKVPKQQQQQQANASSKRSKIRTIPPKNAGLNASKLASKSPNVSGSGSRGKSQGQTPSNKSSKSSRGSSTQTAQSCGRNHSANFSSTNAKSPIRVPPRRLAPSGGDSSTATPQSQGQGQGNLAQAIHRGQYVLPIQGQNPSHQLDIMLDNSIGSGQNQDGVDGFLRPNPIGETDSGARPVPASIGDSNQLPMMTVGAFNQVVGMPSGQIGVDGDGDESGSLINELVASGGQSAMGPPLSAFTHQMVPPSAFRQPQPSMLTMMDRQVPGTSINTPHVTQTQLVNPSVTSSGFRPQRPSAVQYPQVQGHNPQSLAMLKTPLYIQQQHQQPHHQQQQLMSLAHQQDRSSQSYAIVSMAPSGSAHLYGHSSTAAPPTLPAADSTHIHSNHTVVSGAAGGGPQRHKSGDSYHAWDKSLELSPISRTSGITDRAQLTLQTSPNSAINGRDTQPQNLSFGSNSSDRGTTQNEAPFLTTDIMHMEQLRGQIHNMLRMTGQVLPDKNCYDQTNGGSHTPSSVRPDDDDGTLTLSDKVLSELSADLGTVLSHSSRYFTGHTAGAPSQQLDTSSLRADNQSLHENLEKEKFRRKHCEKQIADLQSRLLELQQQLAVAISTDRKKDVMIEQLDKTLAQLVEGWKRKENDKQKTLQALQEENATMRSKQRHQQELLDQFERDLTETVDQLAQEQHRSKVNEQEQAKKISSQQEELSRLSETLGEQQQTVAALEEDKQVLEGERDEISQKYRQLKQHHEEEKDGWDEKERDYLQKIDEITENHLTKMAEEKAKLTDQTKDNQELQLMLATSQKDVQKLQLELDSSHREKESLKVQMGLLEAKSESLMRKQEADLQAQFEKQILERLEEERQEASERLAECQERHRRQLSDITQRHQQEAEAQLQRHEGEVWRAEDSHKRQIRDKEDKIELLQQEISDLNASNKTLEQQRSEMTVKLQSMMQAHCNEALRLLQMGSQSMVFSKEAALSSLYSGISNIQDRPVSSLPNSLVAMSTPRKTVTTTTSVNMTGLRPSVIEAATRGSTAVNKVEDYLQSLDGVHANSTDVPSNGVSDVTQEDDQNFQPLSESLNQSMTSELTQIPFHPPGSTPPGLLDSSQLTSVSMTSSSKPQMALFPQDSALMSLVQSLPTTQVMMSVPPAGSLPVISRGQPLPNQPHNQHHQLAAHTSELFLSGHSLPSHSNVLVSQPIMSSVAYTGMPEPQPPHQSGGGPTIMLHPPVQRDHVSMTTQPHNVSFQSAADLETSLMSQFVVTQAEASHHFEPLQQNTSMNTTASSDFGYPQTDGARASLLSHILQQHLSGSGSPLNGTEQAPIPVSGSQLTSLQDTIRSADSPDLANVTEKFNEHESRQQELQHYIRMLLQRSPSASGQDESENVDETLQKEPETTPKKKSVAFSKTTVLSSPPAAPGGPAVFGVSGNPLESNPVNGSLGHLSPQQVGEISRLLGLYGGPETSSPKATATASNKPPVEDLLAYLRDLQQKNERLSSPPERQIPTRDKKLHSPPSNSQPQQQQQQQQQQQPAQQSGARSQRPGVAGGSHPRQQSPTRTGHPQTQQQQAATSKAKKNLEQTYHSSSGNSATSTQQHTKHVIKIPSVTDGGSVTKTHTTSRQSSASTSSSRSSATSAPRQGGGASGGGASGTVTQTRKNSDRKAAPSGKPGSKGSSVWK